LGGLGATYDDHLRLIGKRVLDFLLALIELFRYVLRLRRSERMGDFSPMGPVDPKFQVEGVAPTNHSSSQKTRLTDLSYGIKIWTDLSSVLSQFTRLTDRQTDTQTDRRTAFSSLYRVCIPCSAVEVSPDFSSKKNKTDKKPSSDLQITPKLTRKCCIILH